MIMSSLIPPVRRMWASLLLSSCHHQCMDGAWTVHGWCTDGARMVHVLYRYRHRHLHPIVTATVDVCCCVDTHEQTQTHHCTVAAVMTPLMR